MLFLKTLYKLEDCHYEQLEKSSKKLVELSVHEKIVATCGFTSKTPIYQWKKNGGLIPIGSAILLSKSINGASEFLDDYTFIKRGPKPKEQNQIAA